MSERDLFLAALDIDDVERRAHFLAEQCGADHDRLKRLQHLLLAKSAAGSFLESAPVVAVAPPADSTATFGAAAGGPTSDHPGKDEHAGAVIGGKYTLVEAIGEGGMGSVWRAKQTEPVKRYVAVKLIKAGMDSRQVLARFEAERQALALMDHPNIAKVLDGGLHDGRPFFAMELVKGVPITEYCDHHKLTPRERLGLFVPVCQAIQHAHQKGVIHRDIKPSNVLIALYDDKPVVKVIDFGVAKATGGALTEHTIDTGFGGVVGTPQYMSPEQATFNNLDIDTRSDVYALGVLLYELLTGTTPFSKKELEKRGLLEILRVVREEEPPRPSTKLSTADALPTLSANRGTEPKKLTGLLRNELDWIVMKALEKDRTRRYETANGFAADVLRYLGGEAVQAHPPSASYRLRKLMRRNKGPVLATGLVALALLAGVAVSTWQAIRATQAEHVAGAERDLAQQARDAAETARRAEAEQRSEVERQKQSVEQQRDRAVAAERQATAEAQKAKVSEAESRAVLDFLLNQVLAVARPKALGGGLGVETTVRAALDAAEMRIKESFKNQPLVEAAVRDSLGTTYSFLGESDLSLRQSTRALALRQEKLGPDHPDTLNSMTNLASAYLAAGKVDKALLMYEQILQTRQAKLGPDHTDTLMSMHTLGGAYLAVRKFDKALPLYEQLLQKKQAKLGPDHPDTLASMNMFAAAYQSADKFDKAVPLYEQTLQKMQATLGPDHPSTLTTMSILAAAYLTTDQIPKGLRLGEESLRLTRAKLGPEHPNTLTSIDMLGMAYLAAGEFQKGLPLCEEALKLTTAKFGPDHPTTLNKIDDLADAYQEAGKPDLALPLFERAAVGVEKRQFKHEHAQHIIPNTIRAYEAANQHDKAEAWRRKWLAAVKDRSGADSLPYAAELAALGSNLLQQKKWADAESVLRECLAFREKEQPDAWTTFNTTSMLGAALQGQKKHADAEPLLLKGYEGMKAREKTIPPQADTRIPEALDRLIELYTATNTPAETKRWRAERAKYPSPREVAPPPREKK